jgi:hypothetical protein
MSAEIVVGTALALLTSVFVLWFVNRLTKGIH